MEATATQLGYDLSDLIRRAKGHPDKTGPFRRDTLHRLIDATRSTYPNQKILAARNISLFFNDFSDLEEEAINAVYDLCEDQSSNVRIAGYTAVTTLSNADHRLIKRNADVLLQLLQSDEPEEVTIVKQALVEHLDMDLKVTLSVLCDQIVPLDDSVDEEERGIRDRLRGVVLAFLTGEAKRAIVERHTKRGNGAEDALIDGLLDVIPKLAITDVELIVKQLLIPLQAFHKPSSRGHDLLRVLLDNVSEFLRKGTRSGDVSLLHSAQPYLDLAGFVVVEKRAAPAIQLLRVYCTSMSTKMNLQKFTKLDQQLIVCRLAETFETANGQTQPEDDGPSLESLSRQIADSCPFLLESLRLSPTSSRRSLTACVTLLQACLRRSNTTHWALPPNLITALSTIQTTITREQSQDVHNLIRSLVPPASTSENPQHQAKNQKSSIPQNLTRSNEKGLPSSLPERPSAPYPARRMHITSNTRPQDRLQPMAEAVVPSQGSASTSIKHQLDPDPSTRPPKKQRNVAGDDGDKDSGPSLLSRLGTSMSSGPIPRTNSLSSRTAAHIPRNVDASELPTSIGELSIKGAAKLGGRNLIQPTVRKSQPAPSFSLLERLESVSSTKVEDGRGGWVKRQSGRP